MRSLTIKEDAPMPGVPPILKARTGRWIQAAICLKDFEQMIEDQQKVAQALEEVRRSRIIVRLSHVHVWM